jgi:hypothetical protein
MKRALGNGDDPVVVAGLLRCAVGTADDDSLGIDPEQGECRVGIALLIVEGNVSQIPPEKWCERRMVRDEDIYPRVR